MAKTINTLLAESNIVKNETRESANTANRVGGLFCDVVDFLSEKVGEDGVLHNLSDMSDVDLNGASTGEVLKYDGTKWVPGVSKGVDGKYTQYIYKNANTVIRPASSTSSIPSGWSTTATTPNFSANPPEYTWCTYRQISYDNMNNPIYGAWEEPYRITGDNGLKGKNAVRLSLDNEHEDFIYTNSQELPISPNGGASSVIHLYDGDMDVINTIQVADIVVDSSSTGVPTSGPYVPRIGNDKTLYVPHIISDSAKVVVRATYNNVYYYATFTANKAKQDKYELILKPNSLAYNSSLDWERRAITVRADKTDLQGHFTSGVTINTTEVDGLRLYYYFVNDNGSMTQEVLLGTNSFDVPVNIVSNYAGIYFELRFYTGNTYRLCDYETVEIAKVKNGGNSVRLALDNEHEDFIYTSNQTLPISPNGGATSAIHLYDGENDVTDSISSADITIDASSTGIPLTGEYVPRIVNKVLSVPHITSNSAKVVVRARYVNTDYYAAFTANKATSDKYDLVLKPNSISYNSSLDWNDKPITVRADKTDLQGNVTTGVTINTTAVDGLRLYYCFVNDNGTMTSPVLLNSNTFNVTEEIVSSSVGIYFELRLYTGQEYRLCDYETVEIAKVKNGTSIDIKGSLAAVAPYNTELSLTGISFGDLGIIQGNNTIYRCTGEGQNKSWQNYKSAEDGDSYIMRKDCLIDLNNSGTAVNIKNHLIMWSAETHISDPTMGWQDLGVIKGEDGESPYTLDLNNEMDSVPVNEENHPYQASTLQTTVTLYYGSRKQTLSSITVFEGGNEWTVASGETKSGINVKWDLSTGVVSFVITTDAVFTNTKEFVINTTSNEGGTSISRSGVFSVNGIEPGPDGKPATVYNLKPDKSQLTTKTLSSGFEPSGDTIVCGCVKSEGDTITPTADASSEIDNKYNVYFRYRLRNNRQWETQYHLYGDETYHGNLTQIGVDFSAYDSIEFILCTNNQRDVDLQYITNIIDRETVPVVADGKDATSPYFLDLSNEMDGVAVDNEGKPYNNTTLNSSVSFYKGSSKQEITAIKVTESASAGVAITWTTLPSSDVDLSFAYSKTGSTINGTVHYVIECSINDGGETVKKTCVFTVNGLKPGPDGKPAIVYNLLPSESQVNVSRNDNGSYNPSSVKLTCGYIKNEGGVMSNPVIDAYELIDNTYYIYVRLRNRSNKSWSPYYRYGGEIHSDITVTGITVSEVDSFEFILCKNTGETIQTESEVNGKIDVETVPVVSDGRRGEAGESPYFADLSNEMDSVAVDKEGKPYENTQVSTTFSFYKGITPYNTLTNITVTDDLSPSHTWTNSSGDTYNGVTISWNLATGVINFAFDKNNAVINNTIHYTITASISDGDNVQKTCIFTLNGLKPGEDGLPATVYNLKPDKSQLTTSKTSSGFDPRYIKLKCGYTKNFSGSTTHVEDANGIIDNKYYVYFRLRDRVSQVWQNIYGLYCYNDWYDMIVNNGVDVLTYDIVEFSLCEYVGGLSGESVSETAVTQNRIDVETVPVVFNGEQGKNGYNSASVILYKRSGGQIVDVGINTSLYYKFSTKKLYSNQACTTEATSSQLNYWSINIPDNSTEPIWAVYVYISSQNDVVEILKTEWNGPTKYSDNGTSPWLAHLDNQMDSIVVNNAGKPLTTQTIKTVASLLFGNTSMPFTIPSSGGVFRNSIEMPYDTTITGWTIANSGVIVRIDGNNLITVDYNQSSVISGKDEFTFKLKSSENSSIIKSVRFNVIGVSGDRYNIQPSETIVKLINNGTNYTPSTCTLTCGYRCMHVDGTLTIVSDVLTPSGGGYSIDGKYELYFRKRVRSTSSWQSSYYRYYSNKDSQTASQSLANFSTTTYDAVEFVISDVNKAKPSPSEISGSTIMDQQTVLLLSDGASGTRGKVGRFYYYGGVFNPLNTASTFSVTDANVPFFKESEEGTNYYVFNPETTPSTGVKTMAQMWSDSSYSFSNAPWEKMTNDFKYLISEAIFSNFAKLGAAIFNGDWMISQYGTLYRFPNSEGEDNFFKSDMTLKFYVDSTEHTTIPPFGENIPSTFWHYKYDEVTTDITGSNALPYTFFKGVFEEDLSTSQQQQENYPVFLPNWAVDLKTGKTRMAGGMFSVESNGSILTKGTPMKFVQHITTENITQILGTSYNSQQRINNLADVVYFDSIDASRNIILPSFIYKKEDDDDPDSIKLYVSGADTIDEVRSYIGREIIIYNNISSGNFSVTISQLQPDNGGITREDDALYENTTTHDTIRLRKFIDPSGGTLSPGEVVSFKCVLATQYVEYSSYGVSYEVVVWETVLKPTPISTENPTPAPD